MINTWTPHQMKDFSSQIRCDRFHEIIINREYQNLLSESGFESFETVWRYGGGQLIKNIKERSVTRIEATRRRILYLKRHRREFLGIKRLAAFFSKNRPLSQGLIEFYNICEFRKHGLATVIPVAAGQRIIDFFRVESFLITEDFSPFISIENLLLDHSAFLADMKDMQKRRTLLEKISDYARRMHASGLNHCDFNSNHVLLDYDEKGERSRIILVDLQRVARNRFLKFRWIIKSLAEMNFTLPENIFTVSDRIFMFLAYKGKRRCNMWDKLQWFWIKKKTDKIKRHTQKIIARRKNRAKA
jgi:hypothetical protein